MSKRHFNKTKQSDIKANLSMYESLETNSKNHDCKEDCNFMEGTLFYWQSCGLDLWYKISHSWNYDTNNKGLRRCYSSEQVQEIEDSITVCYSTCSKCIDDIIRNKVVKNLSIF